MSTAASAKVMMLRDSARAHAATPAGPAGSALAEFEQVYRGNFDVVTGYFARRCTEPQIAFLRMRLASVQSCSLPSVLRRPLTALLHKRAARIRLKRQSGSTVRE